MTDPNAMTAEEQRAVDAAIEARNPVRMRRPDGRVVPVLPERVAERVGAGYTTEK